MSSDVPPPAHNSSPPRVRPFARGRLLQALVLISAMLTTFAALHAYVASRIVGNLPLTPGARELGYLLCAALFVSLPIAIFVGRLGPEWIAAPSRWLGFIWMGTFGVLLTGTVVTDLLRALAWLLGFRSAQVGLWQAAAIGLWAVPATLYALWAARHPRIVRERIALRDLGPGMEGVRLVQISDVHIGSMLHGPFLEALVQKVNALQPDIVAITGDLVDGAVDQLREQVKPLTGLRATLGVFFVTGNHEYYSGVEAWIEQLKAWGIRVLLNEHALLTRDGSSLALGGITDHSGGGFLPTHAPRPDLAFAGAPPGVPRVLLAHQPRSVVAAAAAGTQLQLSGHTHGGQIFPFHLFVRLQQPTLGGLTTLHGVQVYTHRGSGFWGPPMRLFAPPEIAELTLTRAER